MKYIYIFMLFILSVIESTQLYNLFINVYSKETALVLSFFSIAIYVIVSMKSTKKVRYVLSFVVFGMLVLSYSNAIREKIDSLHSVKQERINAIEQEIKELLSKLFKSNERKCDQGSKYYNTCIYFASLEMKQNSLNKNEIKNRISELKELKESIKSEKVDYSTIYFSIAIAILSSLFMSLSILEISNRLKEKEDKSVIELLEKGYSIEQVMKKLNLSRATVYRRLKNERS